MRFLVKLLFFIAYGAFVLVTISQFVAGQFPYFKLAIAAFLGWGIISVATDKRTPEEIADRREQIKVKLAAKKNPASTSERLAFERVSNAKTQNQDLEYWTMPGRRIKAPIPIPVVIRYQSQQGEITTRKLDVPSFEASIHRDKTVTLVGFDAFCHLRNEERSFHFDTVEAAADPATGELIEHFGTFVVEKMGKPYSVRRHTGRQKAPP